MTARPGPNQPSPLPDGVGREELPELSGLPRPVATNDPPPHRGQPTVRTGVPLDRARLAVVMLHGRGASANAILSLARALRQDDAAYLAPEAAGGTWYPRSFLAPLAENQPWLDSALEFVDSVVASVGATGIPSERTVILGFSQGACLALEFAARNPRRYGGVVALSGGLIGTSDVPGAGPPANKRFDYAGDFAETPAFLGCGDPDAHIPVERVRESARVLRGLGAEVTEKIYPGAPHAVNEDEVRFVRELLRGVGRPNG